MLTAPARNLVLFAVFCLSLIGIRLECQTPAPAPGSTPAASAQDDPLQRPRPAKKRHPSKAEQPYRVWLEQDVPYIILPEERDAFLKLTNDNERANFVEHFWQLRDPSPDTEENEYKEEHYRRIAFANERFAAGMPGWKTDRGRIYIIHGPPDSIEAHPAGGPYLRPAEEGGGQTETYPFEVWHYRYIEGIGQNIDIEFDDTCNCGAYKLTFDRGEKDALKNVPNAGLTDLEAMGRASKADRGRNGFETLGASLFGNSASKEFDRMELYARLNDPPPIKSGNRPDVHSFIHYNLLPFDVRVDFVKDTAQKVLTPITIQVPNRLLTYVMKDGVQRASLSFSGTVTNLTGRIMATFDQPLQLSVPADQLEKFAGNVSLYQTALFLSPGRYRLDIMLKDVNGEKMGLFARAIQVPNFSDEDKLSASTLILADMMDPVPPSQIGVGSFVLGKDRVRPRVSPNGEPATFARGQNVNLWMQVYNLALDKTTQRPSARVEYRVVNVATNKPAFKLVQTSEEMGHLGSQLTLQQRVSADRLEPGVYQLTIKVNDLIAQQTIAPEARFVVK